MRPYTLSQRKELQDFLGALFGLGEPQSITDALRAIIPPRPFRVRMKAIYARGGVATAFEQLSQHNHGISILRGSAFALEWTAGESVAALPFAVLPTEHPPVSVVATVARREEWQLLLRTIRHEYPRLVPILLPQRELLQSVANLQKRVSGAYQIRVREISAKERIAEAAQRTRTLREWTDEDWDKAISLVLERRQTVTKVALAFHRRIGTHTDITPSAFCKISKAGEVEIVGNYDLIWENVLSPIAKYGAERLSFFSQRGLRERRFRPAPLAITYARPILGELEEVRRLVRILADYPHSMHSVQHGNPYAHVQLADIYDGSAFDVWAVSPTSVTIVPRLKATEAAVSRLVYHILERFGEGEVEEYGRI